MPSEQGSPFAAVSAATATSPFQRGRMVLVTLGAPREKFWGALLELAAAGVTLRGIDLNAFADFAAMVKAAEPATPETVFFPMHRVERILLDEPEGAVPSLAEQFAQQAGRAAAEVFAEGSASA